MSEPKKTVILILLLVIGISTFFWGRWRLKNQLANEINGQNANQQQIQVQPDRN
jgi:C4-dicarboxylate transporter